VALNPAAKPCEVRLPAGVAPGTPRSLAGETAAFRCAAGGWTGCLPAVSYAIVSVDP
jgi:hypothetical protein